MTFFLIAGRIVADVALALASEFLGPRFRFFLTVVGCEPRASEDDESIGEARCPPDYRREGYGDYQE
jgi:hypothetical protein